MEPKKIIGNKEYQIDDTMQKLASDLNTKHSLELHGIKIGYMKVYPHISKTVAGRCTKTSAKTKFFSDFDYIIEMSGELWDSLDDATKEILMYHELLHILVEYDKNGDPKFKLRDHDVKDFQSIISKYGIDWLTNLKTMNASVYDLDPATENKLNL